MNTPKEHRLVNDYLKRFDTAARKLDPARRSVLREEIASHLREATSLSMSDEQVREVIQALGTPENIVGEEMANGVAELSSFNFPGARFVRILLAVLAVVAGIGALVVMLPSIIAYLTAPGLIFSAFVWTLGGALVIACVVLAIAASRYRQPTRSINR